MKRTTNSIKFITSIISVTFFAIYLSPEVYAQKGNPAPQEAVKQEVKLELPSQIKVQVDAPIKLAEDSKIIVKTENNGTNWWQFIIPAIALIISVISFYFSRQSWKESNRPIVIARVSTHSAGNNGTALNIIIKNTGNRPAKNVRLSVNNEKLESLWLKNGNVTLKEHIKRCFSEEAKILILESGREASNSFGAFSRKPEDSVWDKPSILEIHLSYQDLDGRKYNHVLPIKIADDAGFAGGFWAITKESA